MPVVNRDLTAAIVTATATAAAATATATLSSATGRRACIQGFSITGLGATATAAVEATVSGGPVTMKFLVVVPAGVTVGLTPLTILFGGDNGLPASADATDIVVTVPSFGSGNTKAVVSAWGKLI